MPKKGDMLLVAPRQCVGCNWMLQVWRHMGSLFETQRGRSSISHSKLRILLCQRGKLCFFCKSEGGQVDAAHLQGMFFLFYPICFWCPTVAKLCCTPEGKRCTQLSKLAWGCGLM